MFPRQPAWIVRSVGSSRIARSAAGASCERSNRSGSGLNWAGSSSLPKRSSATSYGPGSDRGEIADELERDRNAALHVGRAAAVHRAVGDSARHVVLRGHGVVVADEQNERHVRLAGAARTRTRPRPHTRARTPPERARAGGRAPLPRAGSRRECRPARASARPDAAPEVPRGERTGILSASPADPTPRQGSSPRRGSCWPCSRKGPTPRTSWASFAS